MPTNDLEKAPNEEVFKLDINSIYKFEKAYFIIFIDCFYYIIKHINAVEFNFVKYIFIFLPKFTS